MTVILATVVMAMGGGEPVKVERGGCQTRACHHRVARKKHRRKWKGKPWRHAYHHLDRGMKGKLRRVRMCESTNNPAAVSPGGTYLGYYQYDRTTWREAGGGRTLPHRLTGPGGRAKQHVITARFSRKVGWSRWPVCGRR